MKKFFMLEHCVIGKCFLRHKQNIASGTRTHNLYDFKEETNRGWFYVVDNRWGDGLLYHIILDKGAVMYPPPNRNANPSRIVTLTPVENIKFE